jgi:hypothetical protein
MKHFIAMVAIATLASCAQDTPSVTPEPVDPNAPTTFNFSGVVSEVFEDAMSGYYDEETGECFLIAEHGNLIPNLETDTVEMIEYHTPIYLFYHHAGFTRLKDPFTPERGKHTTFIIPEDAGGIDIPEVTPYTWPH